MLRALSITPALLIERSNKYKDKERKWDTFHSQGRPPRKWYIALFLDCRSRFAGHIVIDVI